MSLKRKGKKSETDTEAASVLKQDPSTKHIKGSRERYLLVQTTTCEFSGYSPLSNYETTLEQQLNGEQRDVKLNMVLNVHRNHVAY